MDLKKLDDIKINFIVGIGRSGSTLLVSILNQHPNCISTPELHHFIRFYKKYRNINCVSESLITDYKNYLDLFFTYKVNPLIGPKNNTLLDSLKVGEKISYSQLTKLIYLGMYGDKGLSNDITVIVDKNPYYTLQLDKITKIFPDAKFIALVRDYRGFLLSTIQSKKIGTFKKTPYYHALTWNLFMSKIIGFKKQYPDRIKIIRYEDLVSNKEMVIRDLFNFIGLSFHEGVFDFYKNMKEKLSSINPNDKNYTRMLNKLQNLSSPVNISRIDDWKSNLSSEEIKICDTLCSTYGTYFGYEKETKHTFFDLIKYKIIAFPDFIKVKIYEVLRSPELHLYYIYKIKKSS